MKDAQKDRARDTGLALVFICLVVELWTRGSAWVAAAIILLLLAMLAPGVFRPVAGPWFGLAERLGAVMSKVLFGVIYLLLAAPVGLLRRLLGADPMDRRGWKGDKGSAFHSREHVFGKEDLEKPY